MVEADAAGGASGGDLGPHVHPPKHRKLDGSAEASCQVALSQVAAVDASRAWTKVMVRVSKKQMALSDAVASLHSLHVQHLHEQLAEHRAEMLQLVAAATPGTAAAAAAVVAATAAAVAAAADASVRRRPLVARSIEESVRDKLEHRAGRTQCPVPPAPCAAAPPEYLQMLPALGGGRGGVTDADIARACVDTPGSVRGIADAAAHSDREHEQDAFVFSFYGTPEFEGHVRRLAFARAPLDDVPTCVAHAGRGPAEDIIYHQLQQGAPAAAHRAAERAATAAEAVAEAAAAQAAVVAAVAATQAAHAASLAAAEAVVRVARCELVRAMSEMDALD